MKKKMIARYLEALDELNTALMGNNTELMLYFYGRVKEIEGLLNDCEISVFVIKYKKVTIKSTIFVKLPYVETVEVDGVLYEFTMNGFTRGQEK